MIRIKDIFVTEDTKAKIVKYGGPLLIAALIYSIIEAKKIYISLTNDKDLIYYKRFSKALRTGAFCFGIAIAAVCTNNFERWGDSIFWILTICFVLGGCFIYYSFMYVLDEKKIPSLPPNVQYIIKPNLKDAGYWMLFAVGLGILLCFYKLCIYIMNCD